MSLHAVELPPMKFFSRWNPVESFDKLSMAHVTLFNHRFFDQCSTTGFFYQCSIKYLSYKIIFVRMKYVYTRQNRSDKNATSNSQGKFNLTNAQYKDILVIKFTKLVKDVCLIKQNATHFSFSHSGFKWFQPMFCHSVLIITIIQSSQWVNGFTLNVKWLWPACIHLESTFCCPPPLAQLDHKCHHSNSALSEQGKGTWEKVFQENLACTCMHTYMSTITTIAIRPTRTPAMTKKSGSLVVELTAATDAIVEFVGAV